MGKATCSVWTTFRLDKMVIGVAANDYFHGTRNKLDVGFGMSNSAILSCF